MAWTYSGDPGATERDRLRFLLGDTQQADQLLSDAEIAWCLGVSTDANHMLVAGARGARAIAARYHREAELRSGAFALGLHGRAERYEKMARRFDRGAAAATIHPLAGGTTYTDPVWWLGMSDNPPVASPV